MKTNLIYRSCDHGFALSLLSYSLHEGIQDYTYDGHGVLNGSKDALELYSLYGMVANLKQ
jgi:hypothetical protein